MTYVVVVIFQTVFSGKLEQCSIRFYYTWEIRANNHNNAFHTARHQKALEWDCALTRTHLENSKLCEDVLFKKSISYYLKFKRSHTKVCQAGLAFRARIKSHCVFSPNKPNLAIVMRSTAFPDCFTFISHILMCKSSMIRQKFYASCWTFITCTWP